MKYTLIFAESESITFLNLKKERLRLRPSSDELVETKSFLIKKFFTKNRKIRERFTKKKELAGIFKKKRN